MAVVIAAAATVAAAAMHGYMFIKESVEFAHPDTLSMFEIEPVLAPTVRLWAFHQGVYNLLLGLTGLSGVVALLAGSEVVGTTLVEASALFMVAAAASLILADRRRRRIRGFLAQATPPLVALAALALR